MQGWLLVISYVAVFGAGWFVRQIYGAGIIKKLLADKVAAEAELARIRGGAAAWVGGAAQKQVPTTKP